MGLFCRHKGWLKFYQVKYSRQDYAQYGKKQEEILDRGKLNKVIV